MLKDPFTYISYYWMFVYVRKSSKETADMTAPFSKAGVSILPKREREQLEAWGKIQRRDRKENEHTGQG